MDVMVTVYLQNLSARMERDAQRPALRNPDGFFPEHEMAMPDPIGIWAVRFFSSVGDWTSDLWAAIRAMTSRRAPGSQPAPTTRSQG
jgi:hypothetical protein